MRAGAGAMNRNAWPRVEELFHAALERAPGERAAFLASACNGDDELRREVESLLAQEGESARLLERPPAEAATQPLRVARGTRLGPYEVVERIGAGGMGEVYRARDTRLGRDVAVKVLPPELAGDPDRLRRFEHEAKAVAALNHPHILTVHDVGTHDGTPYVVTELLEGETLRVLLEAIAHAEPEAVVRRPGGAAASRPRTARDRAPRREAREPVRDEDRRAQGARLRAGEAVAGGRRRRDAFDVFGSDCGRDRGGDGVVHVA